MNLVIAETNTSIWSYHLRDTSVTGVKPRGDIGLVALCGVPVGWDTQLPLKTWALKDHIPSKWCEKCEALAAQFHALA